MDVSDAARLMEPNACIPSGDNARDRQTDPAADPANDSGDRGRARETAEISDRRRDRGAVWNYARASGSGNRGFRVLEDLGVQAIANITREGQPNFVELDTWDPATVEKFRSLMQASKDASKFGAAVTVYSAAEYATMRLFLSEDGKTGGAIEIAAAAVGRKARSRRSDQTGVRTRVLLGFH
jgi:hypothetical protein